MRVFPVIMFALFLLFVGRLLVAAAGGWMSQTRGQKLTCLGCLGFATFSFVFLMVIAWPHTWESEVATTGSRTVGLFAPRLPTPWQAPALRIYNDIEYPLVRDLAPAATASLQLDGSKHAFAYLLLLTVPFLLLVVWAIRDLRILYVLILFAGFFCWLISEPPAASLEAHFTLNVRDPETLKRLQQDCKPATLLPAPVFYALEALRPEYRGALDLETLRKATSLRARGASQARAILPRVDFTIELEVSRPRRELPEILAAKTLALELLPYYAAAWVLNTDWVQASDLERIQIAIDFDALLADPEMPEPLRRTIQQLDPRPSARK